MMKKFSSLLLAITLLGSFSLTAFAQTPDRSPDIPKSPETSTTIADVSPNVSEPSTTANVSDVSPNVSKPSTTTNVSDVSPNVSKPSTTTNVSDASPKPKQLPVFSATSDTLNWKEDKNYTVYIGKTYTIPATSPLRSAIIYRSSDNKVLTISETGTVTPLKEGTVIIYATQGNVTIGKLLTVKVNPNGTGTTTTSGSPKTTTNPDGSYSISIEVNGGSGTGNSAGSTGNSGNNTYAQAEQAMKYLRTYAESQGMTWSVEAKDGGFEPAMDVSGIGVEEGIRWIVGKLIESDRSTIYAEIITHPHNGGEYLLQIYR